MTALSEKWIPKSLLCLRAGYSKQDLVSDLIAGVTVGLVALPLAMAFGIASGVAPQAGIYTAVVAGLSPGARVNFTVPAFPGETFSGVVQRISHTLEEKTRTMPVELDVINDSGRLSPGMFPEVLWPTRRPKPSLFVPATAVRDNDRADVRHPDPQRRDGVG